MRHVLTAIATAGLALAASSGVAAQVTAGAAGSQGLAIDLAVDGTYNSNVAQVSAASAAKEGLKPEDESVNPSVSADLNWPIGAESFFLHGSAGYDFYGRNPILDSQVIALNTGLDATVGHCTGKVTVGYNSQQSSLSELTIGVVRNVTDDKSIAVQATCPRATGFAPSVSLSGHVVNNSNAAEVPSNDNTFTARAGVVYTRPMFGLLSFYGEYDDTTFPNRRVPVGGSLEEDGYQTYAAGISYDRRLGARIEGVAFLSYTELNPAIPNEAKEAGPTYSADVTVRLTGKIKAHLRLDREFQPVLQQNTTYSIQQDYIADATYAISSRLSATIGASSQTQNFKGATLNSTINLTHQTTNAIFGSASLSLGRQLALVLDLREEDRSASLSAYNYTSTRVSLTAKAKF